MRENIKYDANAIKVYATGGVFSKGTQVGTQQMTYEELKSAADEAHMRGLVIAALAALKMQFSPVLIALNIVVLWTMKRLI